MIVDLTARELAAARAWGTERHRSYLARAVPRNKRYISTILPYAGWKSLAKILFDQSFRKDGRGRPSKLTGEKAGTRNALHRIQRMLNEIEHHPAFRNELIVGTSDLVIPVWPLLAGGWSLEFTGPGRMHFFLPMHEDVVVTGRGVSWRPEGGVTWWRHEVLKPSILDEIPSWVCSDEAEHRGWSADEESGAA